MDGHMATHFSGEVFARQLMLQFHGIPDRWQIQGGSGLCDSLVFRDKWQAVVNGQVYLLCFLEGRRRSDGWLDAASDLFNFPWSHLARQKYVLDFSLLIVVDLTPVAVSDILLDLIMPCSIIKVPSAFRRPRLVVHLFFLYTDILRFIDRDLWSEGFERQWV